MTKPRMDLRPRSRSLMNNSGYVIIVPEMSLKSNWESYMGRLLTLVLVVLCSQYLSATESLAQTTSESEQPVEVQPAEIQPAEAGQPSEPAASDTGGSSVMPFVCLAAGVATVLGLIIVLKVNAFIALISAAIVVSLLAAGTPAEKISRVAESFGTAAGKIGIVIALAAVIGTCLLDSGAADRIVRAFLSLLGEKRSPIALMGSGFILAVPVFFDTVFYLLVPLARSLFRTTGKHYLKYILAIAAGAAITHTLVPPTPGPLVMATTLGIDIGVMIGVGGLVALPAAIAGLIFSGIANHLMPIPMRQIGNQPERPPLSDEELPPLWLAALPVVLPVLLISTNTVLDTLAKNAIRSELRAQGVVLPAEDRVAELIKDPSELTTPQAQRFVAALGFTGIIGNANLALLLSAIIAMWMLVVQQNLSRQEMAGVVETSLMSGGVIILITAGGGAFGDMLKVAGVGAAIESMFAGAGGDSPGTMLLVLGFVLAAVLKVAQGSSTVAMITGSAMLAGIASPETLGFHPVYLATAIGGGSLVGSWMNDSGFWIFAKMGGLTEVEALKSWSVLLVVLGSVSFGVTLLLARVLPLI